jgi:glucosamine--fructose-6-phosphate aminotransferase (isomerizing)
VCGIFGYCGQRRAAPIIIEGLKRLEYRGYDSFGIAVMDQGITVRKKQGKISLGASDLSRVKGKMGIGHTRWATHGEPNNQNAHPHLDCHDSIAVVHNGIIENYAGLKRELQARGHGFRSETDTEVIPHLIEEEFKGDLAAAVSAVLPRLEGSYALLVIATGCGEMVAARKRSPLVIGIGDRACLAASDVTPLLEHTERVIYLEDGDIASLSTGGIEIRHQGTRVKRPVQKIDWSLAEVKKGGFAHYMLKEIYEQPEVFSSTMRALKEEEIPDILQDTGGVTLVACGTSYHAALLCRYLIEEHCGIPARVELASEFKYFTSPGGDLVVGVSQSGETADTLAAMQKARMFSHPTLAVTNVLGSTITRLADHTLFMRAGPEISVAATKSFIAELAVFFHLVDRLAGGALEHSLGRGHLAIGEALLQDLSQAVDLCRNAQSMFFVGRGPFYPLALEGALKMKEITYIHAEGYAAGEIKHGPFALLSPETPVVALCPPGHAFPVMFSNIKEMKARGTPMIVLGVQGTQDLEEISDVFIPLPDGGIISHILASAALVQLLAYHTAVALGRDVDQPRNLAKSVTVE